MGAGVAFAAREPREFSHISISIAIGPTINNAYSGA
jgi:hypothetical protein